VYHEESLISRSRTILKGAGCQPGVAIPERQWSAASTALAQTADESQASRGAFSTFLDGAIHSTTTKFAPAQDRWSSTKAPAPALRSTRSTRRLEPSRSTPPPSQPGEPGGRGVRAFPQPGDMAERDDADREQHGRDAGSGDGEVHQQGHPVPDDGACLRNHGSGGCW